MDNSHVATRDSWRNKPLPELQAELALDGTISAEHHILFTNGYIPKSANDKWFIFYEDGWLRFHRAVSGSCIFKLEIVAQEDHFVTPRVLVNRDDRQYRSVDDNYDVEVMAWLIERYLLGRSPAFPQPGRSNKHHHEVNELHITGEVRPKSSGNGFISLDDLL